MSICTEHFLSLYNDIRSCYAQLATITKCKTQKKINNALFLSSSQKISSGRTFTKSVNEDYVVI